MKTAQSQTPRKSSRRSELLREFFFNAYLLGVAKQSTSEAAPKRRRRSRIDRLEGDFFPV